MNSNYILIKHLQIFFAVLLITTCSGTKNMVKDTSSETAKIKATKDSIIKETKPLGNITEANILSNNIIKNEEVLPKKTLSVTFNHSNWNSLLQKHVSEKGDVNYKAIKANRKELSNYITSLGENTPNDHWTKEDILAYWINTYNALTIDLILRHYPIESIKDIKAPWDQRYWKLGTKWYHLNEIEHDILRKMGEPRIHFSIVCASFSCPKLQNEAFTAVNLDAQLTNATKEFLSDPERNTISEDYLELSKIFQWFAKDFKQNGTLIDFLCKYSDIVISDKAKKSYKDYNWDLNE